MDLFARATGLDDNRRSQSALSAEVMGLPGVMTYGQTGADAISRAEALALQVFAERIEEGGKAPEPIEIRFAAE